MVVLKKLLKKAHSIECLARGWGHKVRFTCIGIFVVIVVVIILVFVLNVFNNFGIVQFRGGDISVTMAVFTYSDTCFCIWLRWYDDLTVLAPARRHRYRECRPVRDVARCRFREVKLHVFNIGTSRDQLFLPLKRVFRYTEFRYWEVRLYIKNNNRNKNK